MWQRAVDCEFLNKMSHASCIRTLFSLVVKNVSCKWKCCITDEFDNEYITEYCESVNMPKPMTISRELFYSDKMVTRRYEQLSDKDKSRFNQMKNLAETIKRDTGDYGLIEDLMAQVVAQRFGRMSKDTVALVMRPKGEGLEGGKALERTGGMLKIKKGWGLSQIGLW